MAKSANAGFVKILQPLENDPPSLRILVIEQSYFPYPFGHPSIPKTVPGDRKKGHRPRHPSAMTLPKRQFIYYISFIPAGWKTLWNIIL
jgi:hypothetical protein